MEPAYEVEPSEGGTLEIPTLRMFDRVAGIVVILAGGVVVVSMALGYRSSAEALGYFGGAGCLGWAIYYASLPGIKVALDPTGIEFADLSWSAFLRFPRYRVAWHDVVEVGSRRVSTKYGSYIEAQVKAKISPDATRQFSVTSKDPGYDTFLTMLKEHVDASAIEVKGMGIEPVVMPKATNAAFPTRLQLLFVLFTLASSVIMLAFFAY